MIKDEYFEEIPVRVSSRKLKSLTIKIEERGNFRGIYIQ